MKYLGFIRANLGRNKLRSLFTAMAIALSVLLVCLLLTMPAGLDMLVDSIASNTRISVHNKAGIVKRSGRVSIRRPFHVEPSGQS